MPTSRKSSKPGAAAASERVKVKQLARELHAVADRVAELAGALQKAEPTAPAIATDSEGYRYTVEGWYGDSLADLARDVHELATYCGDLGGEDWAAEVQRAFHESEEREARLRSAPAAPAPRIQPPHSEGVRLLGIATQHALESRRHALAAAEAYKAVALHCGGASAGT